LNYKKTGEKLIQSEKNEIWLLWLMSNDRETVDTSKCLPGTESFNVSELILFFKIQRKTSQGGEGSVRPTQLKRPHALSAVS
jgi:hypothetical protein